MNRLQPEDEDLMSIFVALARAVNEREELINGSPQTLWLINADETGEKYYPTEGDMAGFPLVGPFTYHDPISYALRRNLGRLGVAIGQLIPRFTDPSATTERIPVDVSAVYARWGEDIDINYFYNNTRSWQDYRPWVVARDILNLLRYRFVDIPGHVQPRNREFITYPALDDFNQSNEGPFPIHFPFPTPFPEWIVLDDPPQGNELRLDTDGSFDMKAWEAFDRKSLTLEETPGRCEVDSYVGISLFGAFPEGGTSPSFLRHETERTVFPIVYEWDVQKIESSSVLFDVAAVSLGGEVVSLIGSTEKQTQNLRLPVNLEMTHGPTRDHLGNLPEGYESYETKKYIVLPAGDDTPETVESIDFSHPQEITTITVSLHLTSWLSESGTFLERYPFKYTGPFSPVVIPQPYPYPDLIEPYWFHDFYLGGFGRWRMRAPSVLHAVIDMAATFSDQ